MAESGLSFGLGGYDFASPMETARQLAVAQQVLPAGYNDPRLVAAFTGQGLSDDQVAEALQGVQAHSSMAQVAQLLNAMPEKSRAQYWRQLTSGQRDQLSQLGLTLPTSPHRGLFGSVAHLAGQVLSPIEGVVSDIARPVTSVIGAGFHGLGAGLRTAQHGYRASVVLEDELGAASLPGPARGLAHLAAPVLAAAGAIAAAPEGAVGASVAAGAGLAAPSAVAGLGNLLHVGALRRVWQETSDGSMTFDQAHTSKALELVGGDAGALELARYMAKAGDPIKGVQAYVDEVRPPGDPKTVFASLMAHAQSAPALQDAARVLAQGRISPGRDLAHSVGLNGGKLYTLVSGSGDAAFDWFADPVMWGAKGVQTLRLARRALPWGDLEAAVEAQRGPDLAARAAARSVTSLRAPGYATALARFQGSEPERMAVLIADAVREGDLARATRLEPRIASSLNALLDWHNDLAAQDLLAGGVGEGVRSADDVFDFYKSSLGKSLLAAGKFGQYTSKNVFELPHLSAVGALKIGAKVNLGEALNTLASKGAILSSPLEPGDVVDTQSGLWAGARQLIRTPARFVETMLQNVPRSRLLDLRSDEAPGEVMRLLDLAGDRGFSDQMFNRFMAESTDAGRRAVLHDALSAWADSTGWHGTEEGREAIHRLIQRGEQKYAPGGMDRFGEGQVPTAVTPQSQSAHEFAIPDTREAVRAAASNNVLRTVNRGINNEWLDAAMGRVWKPSVLMRLGFIPRAISEELIQTVLRYGPKALANNVIGEPAAFAVLEGQPWGPFRPIAWAAKHIDDKIPLAMKGVEEGPIARFGDFLAAHATAYTARAFAPLVTREGMEGFSAWKQAQANLRARDDAYRALAGAEELKATDPEAYVALHLAAREAALTAARDPVLQRTLGGQLFSTMKGYGVSNPTDEVLFDRTGQPYQIGTKGSGFIETQKFDWRGNLDPRFIADADLFYHSHWRDGMVRAMSEQVERYVGGPETLGPLRDIVGGDPAQFIAEARAGMREAPRSVVEDFEAFVRTGDPERLAHAKLALSEAGEFPGSERVAQLIEHADAVGTINNGRALHSVLAPGEAIFDPEAAHRAAVEAGERWLNSEHGAKFASRWDRTRDDTLVPRGHVRVWSVHVTPDQTRPFLTDAPSAPPAPDSAVSNSLRASARLHDPGEMASQAELAVARGKGHVLASAVGTTDRDHAAQMMAELQRRYPGFDFHMRYNDVAEEVVDARRLNGPRAPEDPFSAAFDRARIEYVNARTLLGESADAYGPLPALQRHEVLMDHVLGTAAEHVDRLVPLDDKIREAVDNAYAVMRKWMWASDAADVEKPEVMHEILRPLREDVAGFGQEHFLPSITDLPGLSFGPIPVTIPPEGMWGKMTKGWWERVVGPSVDAMSRRPLFIESYVKTASPVRQVMEPLLVDSGLREEGRGIARALGVSPSALREAASLPDEGLFSELDRATQATIRRWDAMEERVDRAVQGVAFDRAMADSLPFIDDHSVRSQFADNVQNLSPFYWAQEAFLRRWARTLTHSPEAVREAQLMMMGFRHAGITRQNEFGEDVFIYPGSSELQDLLAHTAELITGKPFVMPISVPMSGQVKMASPGFDRIGVPGAGPLLGVPMNLLARRFPELAPVNEAVLGPQGSGRSISDGFFPTSVMRVYHAFNDSPEKSSQYASAMMQANAFLETSGHGLPDNATPREKELFLERLSNWTRTLVINRAVFGMVGPASPSPQFPVRLHTEYLSLLRSLGPEEGTNEFIRRNPDATAYTVFGTKNEAGAPLPATTAAFRFITKHDEFLSNYPQAAAWFFPQARTDDPFDRAAYNEQIALGLRTRKTPEEYLDDVKYQKAAVQYFPNFDAYEAAKLRARGNSVALQQVERQWGDWKRAFLAQHPIFADEIQNPKAHLRRTETLRQMREALQDPRLPRTSQNRALAQLVNGFRSFSDARAALSYRRDSYSQMRRKDLDARFINFAQATASTDPGALGFYNRVIRPEVETMTNQNLGTL